MEMIERAETTKESIEQFAKEHQIEIKAAFVPWSESRSFKAPGSRKDWSLNWKITIAYKGRDILTTDYSAGIAHCPYYKKIRSAFVDLSILEAESIKYEIEHGTTRIARRRILPATADVLSSLCLDSAAIDSPNFESWADDCGYDTDSRRAEMIYRACLEHALALRSRLGEALFVELREAVQDF